jgi:protein-disulfide isomerase/uncharacterized membrane protein
MRSNKDQKVAQTSLFISFIGLCVGLYTLWHHIKVNSGALEKASFCSVSEYINCDAVALSPYSEIFGYPLAGLLAVYYTAMLILGINIYFSSKKADSFSKEQHARFVSSSFLLASVALLPTLYFASILLFKLKLLCILCMVAYTLNLILWALGAWLYKGLEKDKNLFSLPPKSSWALLIIGCLVMSLAPIAVTGAVGSAGIDKSMMSTILYQHSTAKQHPIDTAGVPSIGPENAPIVVVEYSDFQCPHCARASLVVPQVVRAFPQARFIFKHFPLDPSCNSSMQGRGHGVSCLAAKTSHCVFVLKGNDAFFRVEKEIFANQRNLSSAVLTQIALKRGGVAEDELKACVESPETHRFIVAQVEEARAIGVTGTPAIYVNGKRLEYGVVASVLKAVLTRYEEALSNARK